ncbi:MAG TPA: hypothetical protein DCQ58_01435, partial [Saprospirales bacterium]|nr:hypothetical protein [Saprospirales bacterium]
FTVSACNPVVYSFDKATNYSAGIHLKSVSSSFELPDIIEFGLLINVEDSGYPFYTLTIEFPERDFSEFFVLNLEEVYNIDLSTLSNSIGKYLLFEYTSEINNALLDLVIDGVSLFNKTELPEWHSDIQVIQGILSNADEETTGDLPGELFITTVEEITMIFPFYITSEIVNANGKEVIGYYDQRTLNTIISLEIKE